LLVLMGVSLLGVILASTASLVVLSQPSEAEAKSAFERLGCIACHRAGGVPARPWDEIVSHFKASAGKYASLDEFVKAEVAEEVKKRGYGEVGSWSELFERMAMFSGKRPDDPGVKTVESFLASLLGVQAPGATPPTTPTITIPPQVTTPPATTPVEERGFSFLVVALAALVIVAAIVLAAFWLARR
jgi:cytochrome c551/c552